MENNSQITKLIARTKILLMGPIVTNFCENDTFIRVLYVAYYDMFTSWRIAFYHSPVGSLFNFRYVSFAQHFLGKQIILVVSG